MNDERSKSWSRREFLRGLSLGGTAAFLGLPDRGSPVDLLVSDGKAEKPVIRSDKIITINDAAAAEPPLETTTIRLTRSLAALCIAPQFLAEELLRAEGFTDIRYVEKDAGLPIYKALASGEVDLSMALTLGWITQVDVRAPIVILAGVHVGCYELFGTGSVRSVRDLKGKTVSVPGLGSGAHLLLAAMAAYVGLDPGKDIQWVTNPFAESMRLLAEGKVDGFMGFPPEPQELRAKKIGHVIVNTITDRPWSRHFCCSIGGNREFVRKHPVATKRAVRAILKSSNICALEPERAARLLVEKGYAVRLDYALEAVKQVPYGKWRNYDPEDTVRFYSLRLHEVGMIKSSPQKIISQGTDWRILRELKRELKA
jgi:NitT/TauT family transport system substrate-binding protein